MAAGNDTSSIRAVVTAALELPASEPPRAIKEV